MTGATSRTPVAPLVEVFSSIQGEGAYVGELQSFVRLAGCPLRCRYCDSESTWYAQPTWRIQCRPQSVERSNPATVADVLEALAAVEGDGGVRTVSLTGGEPLLHPEFLEALTPQLRSEGRRVHLETAGVHAEALRRLLACLDHVSADVKLASTLESGEFAGAHRRFFAACAETGVDLCVKCVVTPAVPDFEFDRAVELVAEAAPGALFIVQPVTPCRLEGVPVPSARIEGLAARAARRLRTRVVPQVHAFLGIP